MVYSEYDIKNRFMQYARGKIRDMYARPSNKPEIKYLRNNMKIPKQVILPELNEDGIGSCKRIYEMNKNKKCKYKNSVEAYIAGYLEHYIILGFTDNRGCIKSFNDHVEYDTSFVSYRLSKLKHISIMNDEKENIIPNT